MTNHIISIDKVSKSFGGVQALKDVSLDIFPGDVLGIIGPNGSGKTTIVNCITGFIKPTSGKIYFKEKDYKSLIIDVRSNPGGLLTSVVDVSDLFFDNQQLIVSTRSRITTENRTYYARDDSIIPESISIVVLIDKYSASAAEILTGVLKDTGRALIIGETSYGKGSVQQIIPIRLGGIKLTISKYFTPSGISIDQIGIEPDIEVKIEEYTDEEISSFQTLVNENFIPKFIEENPNPTEEDIALFIDSLYELDIVLREERIRKEIRDELNRYNNTPPLYDLDYDIVLKEAVNILNGF